MPDEFGLFNSKSLQKYFMYIFVCVHACVRACVRACVHVCMGSINNLYLNSFWWIMCDKKTDN